MTSPSVLQDLGRLWVYLSGRRRRQLVMLLVLMIASSLSEVVSLGAVIPFLGALSNAERLLTNPRLEPWLTTLRIVTANQLVTVLAIVFVLAVLIANGLKLVTVYYQTHLGSVIGSNLSCQVYENTLHQPYPFHVQQNSSDLIQLVTTDTSSLTQGVLIPGLAIITNSITTVALTCALLVIDSQVVLISAVVLGGTYGLIYRQQKAILRRNSQVMTEAGQDRIKSVQEGIGGIRDVLLNSSQGFFQTVYDQCDRKVRRAIADNTIVPYTPRYTVEAVAMTAIALLALTLGRDGDFSQAIPVLGSLALGANRLLPVLQQSFSALAQIQGNYSALDRVLRGLERSVSPIPFQSQPRPLELTQSLQLSEVWFRYRPELDWTLQDLNLTIAARTTVGFVGSTGSGKSTTADLILGLLEPEKGQILVDGQPLQGERLRQWQQGVAHVPQHIFLSDGTIAENIAFGVPVSAINRGQVAKAARLAQIEEFVLGLPAQYETYVGERGIRLSGGQRQRIGIARALYRNTSVIVFDEATSALDNATEREVMAAIDGLSGEFTIILIAHRLSTVERCDHVVELEQGRVVAQGTYEELIENSPTFQRMAGVK
ncbi:ABC transporter ATP-binding protein [Spirulina major]|uniref:ABC transporter ATP-binding protein n=1 Tax=Spirulina major TaxID=270636 RepID=UPI001C31443B|nr:ABC transporter ATP-binding protein [Spirulina major]